MGHLVIEGDEVGHAGPAFHKPMLTGPDQLVILRMPCDGTQDDVLHDLPQHRSWMHRPVIPRILFPAFFVGWLTFSQLGPQ